MDASHRCDRRDGYHALCERLAPRRAVGRSLYFAGIRRRRLVEKKGYPVESYALNAGDATFHSGWTIHAAHSNRSETQREVITVIYYVDGARILEPDSEFRRVDMEAFHPGQKPGEVAASPLNPLLYQRP